MDENKNSFVGPDSSLPPDSTASAGVGFSAPAQNSQVYSAQPQVNQTYSAQPQVNQTYSAQAYQQVPQPTQNYPQTPQYISQPPRHSSNRRSDDIILVPDAPKPPKSGRLKYIIFAVVAVLILATCGIVALVVSNNNSPSSPDNSTTAESSTDSNSSGSSTASTPITPTTDLGKAWMRYATYITEGEAREEGLSGGYDEDALYKIDEEMINTDMSEQEAYFNEAKSLFNEFYLDYLASQEVEASLTTMLTNHSEKLKVLSTGAGSASYQGQNMLSMLNVQTSESILNEAVQKYSGTYTDKDVQEYYALLLEYTEKDVEFYNLANANGCLYEDDSFNAGCEVDEATATQFGDLNSELVILNAQTGNLSFEIYTNYMKELWTIVEELDA